MLPVVMDESFELVLSSPLGPLQKMFNAVPSAPEQVSQQVAQFRLR
jgi:hypothetical protein